MINNWRVLILVLSLMFSFAGCSKFVNQRPGKTVTAVKPTVTNKQSLWQQRQHSLSRKPAWNLKSRIALRFRDDHWTFGLNWAQKNAQSYVMQINNPVTGGLVAKLSRNKQLISLLSDDGRVYQDSDEERLLKRQSGVVLPLKGMQYWVRGLTSPLYKTDKLVLDAKGRPTRISQAGWQIAYSGYQGNNYNAMPRKIVITRDKDSVYLKMIAKHWQGL